MDPSFTGYGCLWGWVPPAKNPSRRGFQRPPQEARTARAQGNRRGCRITSRSARLQARYSRTCCHRAKLSGRSPLVTRPRLICVNQPKLIRSRFASRFTRDEALRGHETVAAESCERPPWRQASLAQDHSLQRAPPCPLPGPNPSLTSGQVLTMILPQSNLYQRTVDT